MRRGNERQDNNNRYGRLETDSVARSESWLPSQSVAGSQLGQTTFHSPCAMNDKIR